MKQKTFALISLSLFLVLLLSPSCKRTAVDEPGPFGPSSFFLSFSVNATPNVILTSAARETSQIRAQVKWGGEPADNQLVVFTIVGGPGYFSDYSQRTFAYTDSDGNATVTYLAPTKYELWGDTFVTIKVQPQTSTPYYTHKYVEIRLLQGAY